MNVSLTADLERFVQAKLASGLYLSASEVVRDALRLLVERDRVRDLRVAELRKELQIGIDSLDRGEGISGGAALAEVRARVEQMRKKTE
ncbi:MAG: type II toxin-antitoxin system ParD family antitoxin [Planctomycetota bacterium]